jgi:ribosomal protein S18 acetylase RimI-like enzyme
MRRELGDGFELDDDPGRVDLAAVHAFISKESYWGSGRARGLVERAIEGSARVVGLYRGSEQAGFARAVSDGATVAYLADVYVLRQYRGLGLGSKLVREIVEGSFGNVCWLLHTADAQELYVRFGFAEGRQKHSLMERRPGQTAASSLPRS